MREASTHRATAFLLATAVFLGHAPARADAQALPPPAIDVVELTVEQIQTDYAAGRYTAAQLTQAFLDRIARFEEHYNAFISMNPRALGTAADLDGERRVTGPRGPLHGVPVVIKDNLDFGGLVTTAGYAGFSRATGGIDMIPDEDAAVVARLRDAGAIILGKTNMPDFAGHGTRTRSSVAGITRNAYDPNKAPGGSSGGTATAVNGSFAVLGLGTETGGSIQNPASAQGLVGLKPTFGLVPLDGVVPVDATYRDVVGPLTRTVRDAAIVLDLIAGPVTGDPATYSSAGHIPEGGYAARLSTASLGGKRFGLVGRGWRDDHLPLQPETEAIYRRAVETLETLGAEVVEDPFAGTGWVELYQAAPRPNVGDDDLRVYFRGLGPRAAFHNREEWEELTGRSLPVTRSPETTVPAEEAGAFVAWRSQLLAHYRSVLADHDLDGLFFPQAGGPIKDLLEDPGRPEYDPNNHPEIPSNIVNDLGVPVVTLPYAYYEDGTPMAVAFIGDLWTEADLLSWAHAFEQATRARIAPALRPAKGNAEASR